MWWPDHFHQPLRRLERGEAEVCVDAVGVGGAEHPAADGLRLRMGHQGADEIAAEALAAMGGHHHHITHPGEGGVIGHRAGKARERASLIPREGAEGGGAGALHRLPRNAGRPVGRLQEGVEHIQIGRRWRGKSYLHTAGMPRPRALGKRRLKPPRPLQRERGASPPLPYPAW